MARGAVVLVVVTKGAEYRVHHGLRAVKGLPNVRRVVGQARAMPMRRDGVHVQFLVTYGALVRPETRLVEARVRDRSEGETPAFVAVHTQGHEFARPHGCAVRIGMTHRARNLRRQMYGVIEVDLFGEHHEPGRNRIVVTRMAHRT